MSKPQPRKVRVKLNTDELQIALAGARIPFKQVKYIDFHQSSLNVGTTPQYFSLTDITAGSAQQSGRVCDSVRLHSMECRINLEQVNSDLISTVRSSFLIWKADDQADVINSVDVYNDITHVVTSPFNYQTRKKVDVIKDKHYALAGSTTSLTNVSNVYDEWRQSLQDRVVAFNYNATTGTGKLYWAISSNSLVSPFPVLNLTFRIYYTDT